MGTGVALSAPLHEIRGKARGFRKANQLDQNKSWWGQSRAVGQCILAGVPAHSGLALRLSFWIWHELFRTKQPSPGFLGLSPRLGERS